MSNTEQAHQVAEEKTITSENATSVSAFAITRSREEFSLADGGFGEVCCRSGLAALFTTQLRVLRLGLPEDRKIGVGLIP